MRNCKDIAGDLTIIEARLASIRQGMVRFDPYGEGKLLPDASADHLIGSLGDLELELNKAKSDVMDMKREAHKLDALEARKDKLAAESLEADAAEAGVSPLDADGMTPEDEEFIADHPNQDAAEIAAIEREDRDS